MSISLLPSELVFNILENINVYHRKNLLNTCKDYYKHRKLLNIKYIIYKIYSDDYGCVVNTTMSICDTLDACKTIIKTDLKQPILDPAYECMTINNHYTIFNQHNKDFGKFHRYSGAGYIIEEIELNTMIMIIIDDHYKNYLLKCGYPKKYLN